MPYRHRVGELESFWDLFVNLVAAFIGFLIARAYAWGRRRRRTAGGRRFWAAFPDNLVVVLPVWEREVEGWTSTEIVGPGDVRALLRLQREMIEIDRTCEVLEESRLTDGRGDLVLLGGGDANAWSAKFLDHYEGHRTFHFTPDQTLYEKVGGGKEGAVFGRTPRGEHEFDAGLIIRAPNPFVPGSGTILLLAGVTGVGTEAAARLVGDDLASLTTVLPDDDGHQPVEIVFTVGVHRGNPLGPRDVQCRPLTLS